MAWIKVVGYSYASGRFWMKNWTVRKCESERSRSMKLGNPMDSPIGIESEIPAIFCAVYQRLHFSNINFPLT